MQSPIHCGLMAACMSLVFAAPAAAQGSDDCASATAISGPGTFPVSTTTATDSAQQSGTCPTAHRDVWFAWTATSTNSVDIQTCNGVSADSVLAVYSGATCPIAGSLLACNDDSCGLQSKVTISAVTGTTYMIQLGGFGAATTYTGQFSIGVTIPPTPCGPATGPDVIVGNLLDVMNVTSSGGVDAVALGTDACNIGSALANWISNTPSHPVIRQNVYRYKVVLGAGRFEQVGLSWLKNSFAAAQSNTCCTCQPGGDGSHLGVGCSDAYSSGLNGAQSNAEPNHLVNAHTGAFTYPPPNPSFSGVVARRCQILTSELEVTGGAGAARYFGEGHYVTADDAVAGNQNNNASWRELTVTSAAGEFSLAFTGVTTRQASAIHAWAVVESGVTLTDVQVPSDGLVVLGSKATSLGGGQWHYEYAVYNMNADRNVGSFSVPVPAGANVSNIGFHDVNYHDGDGNGYVTFTGTDWIGAFAGGNVFWACEPQANNNNANAIRWGSLYNFRFDADAAPSSGVLTMGLWKPGSPNTITGTGDVPGNSAFSSFCPGDGIANTCPCGNNGAAGSGCANSSFASGALLAGSGTASVSSDTAVLSSASMTGPACVFFQGSAQQPPLIVDDGLGCVSGTVMRLGTKAVASSASSYPQAGDPPISTAGAIPASGGTFYYQCFYRNAVTSFCPPATSNRTNGVAITWTP